MQISDMKDLREWAAQRIGSHNETPWDWYQLMKLREALDSLIYSAENRLTLPEAGLPGSELRAGTHLRLVDDKRSQGTAPHRP